MKTMEFEVKVRADLSSKDQAAMTVKQALEYKGFSDVEVAFYPDGSITDAERMDWLEKQDVNVSCDAQRIAFLCRGGSGNLRKKVDEFMKPKRAPRLVSTMRLDEVDELGRIDMARFNLMHPDYNRLASVIMASKKMRDAGVNPKALMSEIPMTIRTDNIDISELLRGRGGD